MDSVDLRRSIRYVQRWTTNPPRRPQIRTLDYTQLHKQPAPLVLSPKASNRKRLHHQTTPLRPHRISNFSSPRECMRSHLIESNLSYLISSRLPPLTNRALHHAFLSCTPFLVSALNKTNNSKTQMQSRT